jgi:hypothetical protein
VIFRNASAACSALGETGYEEPPLRQAEAMWDGSWWMDGWMVLLVILLS